MVAKIQPAERPIDENGGPAPWSASAQVGHSARETDRTDVDREKTKRRKDQLDASDGMALQIADRSALANASAQCTTVVLF